MTAAERWLASLVPFVRDQLPPAPATVLEIGCGSLGGFVPALLDAGYEAGGVDRNAPEAAAYHRIDFEQYEPERPVAAIVACRSLHHVADVAHVLDRASSALRPGGAMLVVEWAWERFDEDTARWCFARLNGSGTTEPGWLHRRRDEWETSGQTWEAYFEAWAGREHLHRGDHILGELEARFERRLCTHGPYFFADLDGVAEEHEQAAIASGAIRATGIRYLGTLRL
jgi:SAM-dependent methyltransferase